MYNKTYSDKWVDNVCVEIQSVSKCFEGSFVNRAQISSENYKSFFILKFMLREKGATIHLPSNEKGLRNIGHSMNVVLVTWKSILESTKVTLSYFVHYDTFITKCNRYYYKMRQPFYFKIRHKFITTKVLLQKSTVVTKCIGTVNNQRCQSIKRARKTFRKHPSWQCFMKTIVYICINIWFTLRPMFKNLNGFYNRWYFAYNSFKIAS